MQEKCNSLSFYEAYTLVKNSHTNKWGNRTTAIYKVNKTAEKKQRLPERQAGPWESEGRKAQSWGQASLLETQVCFPEDVKSVPGDNVKSIQQRIPTNSSRTSPPEDMGSTGVAAGGGAVPKECPCAGPGRLPRSWGPLSHRDTETQDHLRLQQPSTDTAPAATAVSAQEPPATYT